MKATSIRVLEGPGLARQCYGKERTCPESVVARIQYVYPYTTVTFGACAAHSVRNERRAPLQEIP